MGQTIPLHQTTTTSHCNGLCAKGQKIIAAPPTTSEYA